MRCYKHNYEYEWLGACPYCEANEREEERIRREDAAEKRSEQREREAEERRERHELEAEERRAQHELEREWDNDPSVAAYYMEQAAERSLNNEKARWKGFDSAFDVDGKFDERAFSRNVSDTPCEKRETVLKVMADCLSDLNDSFHKGTTSRTYWEHGGRLDKPSFNKAREIVVSRYFAWRPEIERELARRDIAYKKVTRFGIIASFFFGLVFSLPSFLLLLAFFQWKPALQTALFFGTFCAWWFLWRKEMSEIKCAVKREHALLIKSLGLDEGQVRSLVGVSTAHCYRLFPSSIKPDEYAWSFTKDFYSSGKLDHILDRGY